MPMPIVSGNSTQSCPPVTASLLAASDPVHPGLLVLLSATVLAAAVLVTPLLLNRLYQPLPAYALTLRTAESACLLCGAHETESSSIAANRPIDLQVRPLSPTSGPSFLHLYVAHHGKLRHVLSFAQREADGTLHLRGLAREVLDLRGDEGGQIELFAWVSRSPLPLPVLPSSFTSQMLPDSPLRLPLRLYEH